MSNQETKEFNLSTNLNEEGDNLFTIEQTDQLNIGDWVIFTGSIESNETIDLLKDSLNRTIWYISNTGSNYIEISAPVRGEISERDAVDRFYSTLRIPFSDIELLKKVDFLPILKTLTERTKHEFEGLMQEFTSLNHNFSAPKNLEQKSTEIMLFDSSINPDERKQELIHLKDVTLPELQKKIVKKGFELSNLARLQAAQYQVDIDKFKALETGINSYIFNIDLYTGLSEKIQYIKNGSPADKNEKIHIFQEKLYMDEESLLGVMESGFRFSDMSKFNDWLIQPENLNRILPFNKCIVAFQVRRKRYSEREDFRGKYSFDNSMERVFRSFEDKYTYLYFRNGENVGIIMNEYDVGDILFDNEMLEYFSEPKYMRVKRYHLHEYRYYEYDKKAYNHGLERIEDLPNSSIISASHWESLSKEAQEKFKKVDNENLFFDDIAEEVRNKMNEFNRFGLIFMGLLDRSDAFSPHPKISIFDNSYTEHVKLVSDYSAVLPNQITPPDIQGYFEEGRSQIKKGSHVFGAYTHWLIREAERWNNLNYYSDDRKTYHTPTHDPYGCGIISVVDRINNKGEAVFKWYRPRAVKYYWSINAKVLVKDEIAVPIRELYNVDTYERGDYKKFFDDKRTRKNYLKWANYMLSCEAFIRNGRELPERSYMHLHSNYR